MKFLVFFFLILLPSINLYSKSILITGLIKNSTDNSPLKSTSISIIDLKTNKVLGGVYSKEDGTFEVESSSDNFYISVKFIGYETKKISDFVVTDNKINLGTISLELRSLEYEKVTVTAEKSKTEFKLDKRVFNVGKDISSSGASALDVLNNVPSVAVNIEGQVSLRGSSGVQILINGKPSVLSSEEGNALGSITAEMIEKVEVITNPSAKHDAEGTAGIINIVMKKNESENLNGSITLNTGFPNNHSVGLSLNKRASNFNLFSQLGVGYRSLPRDYETINRNFLNFTEINSMGTSARNEEFYNVVLGTDYHFNEYNLITLSGHFAYEIETEDSDLHFNQLENTEELVGSWDRIEFTEATNPKWEYNLQYKKEFEDSKEHDLILSATGDFFGKEKSSEFRNDVIEGINNEPLQASNTDFKEAKFTYKIDYVNPLTKKYTIESGLQYLVNDVRNDYDVSNFTNDSWVENEGLTNLFKYNQKVLGIYTTGSYEEDKWGVKLGIRMENTDLMTELGNTNEIGNRIYTDWFPSLHSSYKFSEFFQFQVGYSRRISRPNLWSLNPFFNIRNTYSVRTGNPNLLPEYTDSYELTTINHFSELSLNMSIYHRYTQDIMERVNVYENDVNISRPENIGTNLATGLEVNGKYDPTDWFSINGDFNLNHYEREGLFRQESFNFSGSRWSSKLTTKLKLPFLIDFELSGNYQSNYKTYQNDLSDSFFMNIGIRKKILDKKGVINFSIRDVFDSRKNESISSLPDYYIYSYSQRKRAIVLGFSYGIGKGEAMEFSGHKRF